MRILLLAWALILLLGGCAGDGFRLGAGSTGPLRTEPDPFQLLGRDLPMGLRLDLAAVRATPSGPDFDVLLGRFVDGATPMPVEFARDVLARTDVVALGARPGPGNRTAEVVVLRGRYAGLDVSARWASEPEFVVGAHRGRTIHRSEGGTVARLDDHLLVFGDDAIVRQVVDRALDHVRAVPGSPSVAAAWAFEDAQAIAVVLPTPRFREEMRRTPPFDVVADSFERARWRVMKRDRGESFELRIETTSPDGARAFSRAVRASLERLAEDPYLDVAGVSAILRALRVEVDDGEVRIVGGATDEEVAGCVRRLLELL